MWQALSWLRKCQRQELKWKVWHHQLLACRKLLLVRWYRVRMFQIPTCMSVKSMSEKRWTVRLSVVLQMFAQASRLWWLCQVLALPTIIRLKKEKSVAWSHWAWSALSVSWAFLILSCQRNLRMVFKSCLKKQCRARKSSLIWTWTMRLSSFPSHQTGQMLCLCVGWLMKWLPSMTGQYSSRISRWWKMKSKQLTAYQWLLKPRKPLTMRLVSWKMSLLAQVLSGCKISSWTKVSVRLTM